MKERSEGVYAGKRRSWQNKKVLAQLKKTGLEVYPLFGGYDFIVIAKPVDLKTATATILEKIHAVRGVTRTLVGAEV